MTSINKTSVHNLKLDDFNAKQLTAAIDKAVSTGGRVYVTSHALVGGSAQTAKIVQTAVAIPFKVLAEAINNHQAAGALNKDEANTLLIKVLTLAEKSQSNSSAGKANKFSPTNLFEKNALVQLDSKKIIADYEKHTKYVDRQRPFDLEALKFASSVSQVYTERLDKVEKFQSILESNISLIQNQLQLSEKDKKEITSDLKELKELRSKVDKAQENASFAKNAASITSGKARIKADMYLDPGLKKTLDEAQKALGQAKEAYFDLSTGKKRSAGVQVAVSFSNTLNDISQFTLNMKKQMNNLDNIPKTLDNVKALQSKSSTIGSNFANFLQMSSILNDMKKAVEELDPKNYEEFEKMAKNIANSIDSEKTSLIPPNFDFENTTKLLFEKFSSYLTDEKNIDTVSKLLRGD